MTGRGPWALGGAWALVVLSSVACSSASPRARGGDPLASAAPPAALPSDLGPAAPAAGGPTTLAALADETGLAVHDDGVSVALVGDGMTARFFPNSPSLSLTGRTVTMSENARRDGAAFVVPGDGASAVRQAVAVHRRTLASYQTPPAPRPAFARPAPKAVARATPRGPAPAGDPSWVPLVPEVRWRWIVVHHSDDESGCCAKYDRIHRSKGWDCCGYDFIIGNGTESGDGEIEVGPRWPIQKHGAHTKTDDNRFNDYGIGIVLVGDFEHGAGPTARQYASLLRLTRWLMARYGIGTADVIRHQDAKPTACPGRNFPWGRFLADLAQGGVACREDDAARGEGAPASPLALTPAGR